MKVNSLLAVTLSLVLVAGFGIPAYAGVPPVTSCTVTPVMVNVQLGPNESVDIPKVIECDKQFSGGTAISSTTCQLNDIIKGPTNVQINTASFDETIQNLGDTSEEHCIVVFRIFNSEGSDVFVTQEIWINETPETVVGGELLPIDSTALLLAGLQTSAIWMLPILAGAAGAGIAAFKLRRK